MPTTEAPQDEADWPRGTLAISALLLVVYFAECLIGLEDPERGPTLVRVGAVSYSFVFEAGEWWRLMAAAFCHHDILHLLLNGWALIQLGALIEDIYGLERFLVVYFLSCLGGTLATAGMGDGISIGASGGIMGLVGFLIAARYVHEPRISDFLRLALGRQLIFWTVFILGVGGALSIAASQGMGVPRVDNYGHMGGLLTGLALAVVVRGTDEPALTVRGAAAALSAFAAVCLLFAAARGEESARLEKALLDTLIAYEKSDIAAVGSGLDAIAATPGTPRRIVGRDIDRARELALASIAAVRTADAVAYGRLAAEIDPERGATILAQARLAAGEETEAKAALESYRKNASLQDLLVVGTTLERQGRSNLAVWFFDAALEKAPDNADVLNNLAWTLLTGKDPHVRDPQRALTLARRAHAKDPLSAAILDTLAEAEFQLGQVNLALDHQEKAVQLALSDPRTRGQAQELVERLEKIRAAAR